MKKILSILGVLLVVTAMLHFSVAQHYCGGEMVASKISFSGELATCGMEGDDGSCPSNNNGDNFDSHCCDDVLTTYFIDNNYTPASKTVAGFDQMKFQAPVLTFGKPVMPHFIAGRSWTDIIPPGEFLTSSVDLSQIMVFRI